MSVKIDGAMDKTVFSNRIVKSKLSLQFCTTGPNSASLQVVVFMLCWAIYRQYRIKWTCISQTKFFCFDHLGKEQGLSKYFHENFDRRF